MKSLYLLLGITILLGGVFLATLWWPLVVQFLAALLICFLVLLGVVIIILAIGEISSRKK